MKEQEYYNKACRFLASAECEMYELENWEKITPWAKKRIAEIRRETTELKNKLVLLRCSEGWDRHWPRKEMP